MKNREIKEQREPLRYIEDGKTIFKEYLNVWLTVRSLKKIMIQLYLIQLELQRKR